MTDSAKQNSALQILHKLRTDFTYYAPLALRIVTKDGTIERFTLNKAQMYIHQKLEDQLRAKGKVRAIIVKGRQQGVSTYTEGRFFWKATLNQGIRAFVITHVASATNNLFSMVKRFYNNAPDPVRPEIQKNNSTELDFHKLDSGYRVSTAGSTGVGRGSTFTHVHGSEVAYWNGGAEHIVGLLQAVPDSVGTEVILESTASGPSGVFYQLTIDALAGKNDFQVIFVPWFWQQEYRISVDQTFEITAEERAYAERYHCDVEQIAWRRNKINTFTRGVADFRREYPATIEEAFTAESENALWSREDIRSITYDQFRQQLSQYDEVSTVVSMDPAGATARDGNDETGLVVATLLSDEVVYVLEDASGKYPPDAVVPKVLQLYYKYQADRLTIETNGVGSWVPNTFAMEDANVVIYPVHARKGKRLRAEPIAHAYRQHRVVHVKKNDLSTLENEMCSWNPYGNGKSPNRIDALVYAVTDLLDVDTSAKSVPVMWSFDA